MDWRRQLPSELRMQLNGYILWNKGWRARSQAWNVRGKVVVYAVYEWEKDMLMFQWEAKGLTVRATYNSAPWERRPRIQVSFSGWPASRLGWRYSPFIMC